VKTKNVADHPLREHVLNLLAGKGAHLDFDSVVKSIPDKSRGKKVKGVPYTAWQLLEHMRITQWDILEFSRDAGHVSPDWPEGYWPRTSAPPDAAAWDKSAQSFRRDLKAMGKLVEDANVDLYARIPHGEGQTILREALLVADHNAYHLGQLVLMRRLTDG
jgi:hypothetical protein